METRFYHLQRSSLDDVLPKLLLLCVKRGWRAVVRGENQDRVDMLDKHLWAFDEKNFLPHGAGYDGSEKAQPVFLSHQDDNPNDANVLFLLDGMDSENLDGFELVCRLFDGNDDNKVAQARTHWKTQKDLGHWLTYWQQNEGGGWIKKAEQEAA